VNRSPVSESPLTPERFDAVLFDLDGVLTDTARVHADCWKKVFDEHLQGRASIAGKPFVPFDVQKDYGSYVDGKSRYDGARDFLESRGIVLPVGTPEDSPESPTICGLSNRKDQLVNQSIAEHGIEAYRGSVALVRHLRRAGLKTGVVSSSHHCAEVLKAAGIADLFDVRIDGHVIDRAGMAGKPAPDAFLAAARQLGVEPARTVVVEDALSGVQAGRSGRFGLVIGVARKGNHEALLDHGAHLAVSDLSELGG
jgi:beta-phosphoglucomutase family hydrolase